MLVRLVRRAVKRLFARHALQLFLIHVVELLVVSVKMLMFLVFVDYAVKRPEVPSLVVVTTSLLILVRRAAKRLLFDVTELLVVSVKTLMFLVPAYL